MVFYIVAFIVFFWLVIVKANEGNYDAALLSMLLMTISGIMFGHWKQEYIYIGKEDDKQIDEVVE